MARATRTAKVAGDEIQTIEFIGPPGRLVAVGDIPLVPGTPRLSGKLEAFLVNGRQALRVRSAGRRGAARIGLRLDPATPPGDYEGAMSAGDEAYRIIARVLPETRVSVLAGELAFSGAIGETAVATLAIANDGNTEIELPRAIVIGLFDDDGLETAFAASYAKPVTGIDALVEVFHGKLRESHSGLQKLSVTKGFGKHGPGTSFAADFALELRAPMRPGRRYHGVVSTDFGEFSISVSVINGASK
jgi:hypothetical protein